MDSTLGQLLNDRYELLSEIGKGGMGVVYRARDVEMDKTVAIKVLPASFARDKQRLMRFRREAKLLASLDHQNIVSVQAFDIRHEDGSLFMIMELVEAGNICAFAKDPSIDKVNAGLQAFEQICAALTFIHDKGIIHRDIKPDNLLAWVDDTGAIQAKLIDFGTGRLAELNENSQKLTQTGFLVGSPAYMSPEQWTGSNPDLRGDLYALGCVMYEYFSGEKYVETTNLSEILYAHLNVDYEARAEKTDLGKSKLTEDLSRVMKRVLEKDPALRYQTAAELGEDLEKLRAGKTLTFRKHTGAKTPKSKLSLGTRKRSKLSLKAGVVSSLVTVAVALPIVLVVIPMVQDKDRAERQKHSQITTYFDDVENKASSITFLGMLTPDRFKQLQNACERYLDASADMPQDEVWLRHKAYAEMKLATAHTFLGEPQEAIRFFKQSFSDLDRTILDKRGSLTDVPARDDIAGAQIAFAAMCWRAHSDLQQAQQMCVRASEEKWEHSTEREESTAKWRHQWIHPWSLALLALTSRELGDNKRAEEAKRELSLIVVRREGTSQPLEQAELKAGEAMIQDVSDRCKSNKPWWSARENTGESKK